MHSSSPLSGIIFYGQQYNNLPDNVVMGMQRVQTLEQANTKARGPLHSGWGS